jgi:hypothetical protein
MRRRSRDPTSRPSSAPGGASPPAQARELTRAAAQLRSAEAAAQQAWTRLEASPGTLEYQIEWGVARRDEAAAAGRLRRAREAYPAAGDR